MRRFLFIIPLLFFLSTAEAAYLDLAWSPNDEADIGGYRVYYGTSSGDYINFVDVGKKTRYQLGDLLDDVTYYIALTAYDKSGNESDFSEEVAGVGLPGEPAVSSTESGDGGGGSGGGCFILTALHGS